MVEAVREGFVLNEPPPPAVGGSSASTAVTSAGNGAAPVPPPRPEWPVTVKLRHKSIIGNNGAHIHELVFREPTAGDILRCGNPVYITSTGEVMFDERKMTLMIAQLSGVLQPLLDMMNPRDWESCAYRLRPFFLPDWESF